MQFENWVPQTDGEREQVRKQLDRLLSHPLFTHSKRYPNLLKHVVEIAISRSPYAPKERTLGVEVFGRAPDYDTNVDPVVRMTAVEIRKRIAQYYSEPGHEEELRIDLPSGSYEPVFSKKTTAAFIAPTGPKIGKRFTRLGAILQPRVVVLVLAAVALVMTLLTFRNMHAAPELRLDINTPRTDDLVSLAISPDGQYIAFVTRSETAQLWVRPLNSTSGHPLAGTDNARFPFWSHDSRTIGFFADGKLKRIDLDGTSLRTLADTPSGRGGTWNQDDVIVFAPSAYGALFRIPGAGGMPEPLTKLASPLEDSHRFPQFLPDSHHFLYYVAGSSDTSGVYVGQINGSEAVRLLDADAAAVYVPSGYLLFVRHRTLVAQKFDASRLRVVGNPFAVADHIAVEGSSLAAVSSSADGTIVFRTNSGSEQRQFVWLDRAGKEIERLAEPDIASPLNPSVSPDGRYISLQRTIGGISSVWLLDLKRAVYSRLTSGHDTETVPIWSPQGDEIVYSSIRNGIPDLFLKSVRDARNAELLLSTKEAKAPMDWSADGRFLLYRNLGPNSFDLWVLPMDGKATPFPVVQTDHNDVDGQFSPDGNWLAYSSDESGRFEIYVQPFPDHGRKIQISTHGGQHVRWRHDGKELFYIGPGERLFAVSMRFDKAVKSIEPGEAIPLFRTYVAGEPRGPRKQQYVVSNDGQRFLMNTVGPETSNLPITVILNWKPEL